MRTRIFIGFVGLMLFSTSANAQSATPGSQSTLPWPDSPIFGNGFAARVGNFGDISDGSSAAPGDAKRLMADRDYLTSHAKSLAELVTLAKKCRRIFGPPSYCDIPAMQQLAWVNKGQ
jgi:hypothetical protein